MNKPILIDELTEQFDNGVHIHDIIQRISRYSDEDKEEAYWYLYVRKYPTNFEKILLNNLENNTY